MEGTAVVSSIIEILVSGITGIATGIGSGLTELVQSIFFTTSGDTTTLSTFGIMIVVFAGISLAIGLSRWVLQFLTSLGSRNQ
jgi:hypothetical protein